MTEIKTTPCRICKCTQYKVISKEKFSQAIKCLGCGQEYSRIDETNQFRIRKMVENKIKTGEIDDKIKNQEQKTAPTKKQQEKHNKFFKKIT